VEKLSEIHPKPSDIFRTSIENLFSTYRKSIEIHWTNIKQLSIIYRKLFTNPYDHRLKCHRAFIEFHRKLTPIGILSEVLRTLIENSIAFQSVTYRFFFSRSNTCRKSIEIDRTPIENQPNINQAPIDHLSKTDRACIRQKSIDFTSKSRRTSVNNLSNLVEQLSKNDRLTYRKSIENPSEIHRKAFEHPSKTYRTLIRYLLRIY